MTPDYHKWIIIVMTIITALVHLAIGITTINSTIALWFVLNGMGYGFLLLTRFFILPEDQVIHVFYIAFVIITIISYLSINLTDIGIDGILSEYYGLTTMIVVGLLLMLLLQDTTQPTPHHGI